MKNHLKRIAAPRNWVLSRKENTFVTRPKPGRSFELAMPLSHIMKVLVGKGRTTKEVKYLLQHEEVLVNGKRVFDHRLPVGFMDVVSFPGVKEAYRVTIGANGKLKTVLVQDGEKRLVKIKNKTRLAGKIQVNCEDGTNILIGKNTYKTADSLLLVGNNIAKHLPIQEGASIMLTGGRHLGKVGTVKEIRQRRIIFTADGEHSTARRHAYVIGQANAEVTVI